MSFLSLLRGASESRLICPRCEKPLDGHDDQACQRKMSRRYFFGMFGAAAAAAIAAPQMAQVVDGGEAEAFSRLNGIIDSWNAKPLTLLTPEAITNDMLCLLRARLVFADLVNRDYNSIFPIGDTITVRPPARFRS
jgi:hypothetical protein